MSIKIQVEDSIFLIENGRYLGALTNLMLAVAASSRKTFPKPATRSYKNPNDSMRDNEAFRVFLSRGIRKLLFGDYQDGNSENIGISVILEIVKLIWQRFYINTIDVSLFMKVSFRQMWHSLSQLMANQE